MKSTYWLERVRNWKTSWLIALAALLMVVSVSSAGGMWVEVPRCGFRAWTGLPCPACGGSRSIESLARFEWRRAVELNPLIALAALAALAAPVAARLAERWPRAVYRGDVWLCLVLLNWTYVLLRRF